MRTRARFCVCMILALPLTIVVGCGSGVNESTPVQSTTYTIGGTVSGLTGSGLVLQDNGGNNLAVSANGAFTFSTSVVSGAAYSVTVLTQPTNQTCTVTNGSGTASANVTGVQVSCSNLPPITYTIAGTVSGLTGSGLVLQDNGGNNLAVSANGAFIFSNSVAAGAAYNVTVSTQPIGQTCTVTSGSGTANANVSNVQVSCTAITYTIGGTVSGLAGTGLVLADNGGFNLLNVSANGAFTFSNPIATGTAYNVTVLSQPIGQSCTVTNGNGTATANVTSVQVTCSNVSYTIGGVVSGLTGSGLILQDNGGNNLTVSANGAFTFTNAVASSAAYSVTVSAQPTGQSCTVTNGSGTASANVTSVQVACSNVLYTIGGAVSGLTGSGLILQDNGGNNLAVSANGAFTFTNAVANGAAYSVTVSTQPTGQSCTVTNGSGTASANVTNVQVTCSNNTYTIGGSVSGLTGTGLVLQDNGGNNLAVSASGNFTFSTTVASGAAYSVTVFSQPTGQSCAVTNGSGTANANVSNIQIACSNFYSIGGTVSGLTGTGLVLRDNGGSNLSVSANGSFTFSSSVASGATYSVTVLTQPTGQSCTVTSGSGTANANVTNVQIVCSNNTYTIGGTVSGLTGTGLVVQNNGGNNLTVSANGSFTFSNSVASGAAYSVTVLAQPSGQSCTVTNGSGTASANVSNVQVTCIAITYTIGGTLSGLTGTGTGVVLQDNGGNNLFVSANGSFTFSNSVASGATYNVTLSSLPLGQTCTVSNGSGTATANVTNVQITCLNLYSIGGTVSGLTGTGLVLQNNGGNNLSVSANGAFTFSYSIASGSAYTVTVSTLPSGQTCTLTNGSGTATANVTNVQVACSNANYTIGGTVSGLTGTGLVLQDNGGNNLSVSANGAFTFSNSIASGATFSVAVLAQPAGQSCTVSNGSGTATANVTNVQVACSNVNYTIGGTVSGLTGTGLILQDNGGNNLSVSANGSFTFSNSIASGATFSVAILTQPTGQSCTVSNGSGTAIANVTNVQVACSNVYYTIGGSVSGLTGTGLVLQDNAGNNLSVSANGSFTFSNSVARSATYSVTVLTQPTGQSCTVTNGSGTATANVTNVQVACSTVFYTIGGTVSGLTGTGLVLQINGGNNLTVSANGTFTFSNSFGSGYPYSVTVFTQPTGQNCTASNGSGTATANVTNIQVTCSNLNPYSIGGIVSGLSGTGLMLQDNGGNNLSVSANGVFTFSNSVYSGSSYNVTVLAQPTGQLCTVTNGSGTASSNVTNVQIACLNLYTIGGTVSGLTGTTLVLQDNGGNNLSVGTNGSFTFTNSVASGYTYSVTVLAQPTGQFCTVTNGSGTASANVTNVQIACSIGYSIGGSVLGLSGTGLVLQDNGGNNLSVSANGSFTFTNSVASGATYSVTVLTQPMEQICTVNSGSGTASANVTNVLIACVNNWIWSWMGGSSVGYQTGVYGTLGTAASTNTPGGRNSAASWSDTSGNLWLFGGYDQNADVDHNDLWKFDTNTGTNGEWTWMGGSSNGNYSGVYGTLGTASSTNMPGARDGGVTWSDTAGNLWLFGGEGYSTNAAGDLNDLWKFDPNTGTNGEWTWMGGSSTLVKQPDATWGNAGVYGTLGTAAPTNIPGGRYSSVRWIDASGRFWLFGGFAVDSTGVEDGYLNDIWMFDPKLGANGEWTWEGGCGVVNVGYSNPFQEGCSAVYGILNTASSGNIPGGRKGATSWTDSTGNRWLFGGYGYDGNGKLGYLNDLWVFDLYQNQWVWWGGSSTVGSNCPVINGNPICGQPGVYGTLGTLATGNIPGSRMGAVSWNDASGNLWLFGGYGADANGNFGDLNDLWVFNPFTNQWAWMGGSSIVNQFGVYGTLGTPSIGNIPGSRTSAASWSDASGNFWLFGGQGYYSTGTAAPLNDLWEYKP